MSNLLVYSGIVTKTKALEAKSVKSAEYQSIANFESTADFIAYLKSHPGYGGVFAGIDENLIHRGQVEGMIINCLYQDFSKLYRFSNPDQRKVLDIVFLRYEVNILKACMHMVFNQHRNYDLGNITEFFNKHSNIDITALATSKSMTEYVEHLKGSDYYSVLTSIQKTDITSFDYEMKLDIQYFMKAWKLKDRVLSGDNLKYVTDTLGLEIDLLNIMWLYRSKKFYNLQVKDAYAYIIPITYKLKKDKLIKLMETSTIEEFSGVLNTTPYEFMVPSLANGTIEKVYQSTVLKNYKLHRDKYPNSMAPISYYLYLKRTEIDRLTSALECIRYKLDPQDTLKYITFN
jgi:V/A-type H+/Na+-transporting ATPase subunit C